MLQHLLYAYFRFYLIYTEGIGKGKRRCCIDCRGIAQLFIVRIGDRYRKGFFRKQIILDSREIPRLRNRISIGSRTNEFYRSKLQKTAVRIRIGFFRHNRLSVSVQ